MNLTPLGHRCPRLVCAVVGALGAAHAAPFASFATFPAAPLTAAPLTKSAPASELEELEWPLRLETDSGALVVYPPQVESLAGDVLSVRAAIAAELAGDEEGMLGVVWIATTLRSDRAERTVTLGELEVRRTQFQGAEPERAARAEALVAEALGRWRPTFSRDRVISALEGAEIEGIEGVELSNDAPEILIVDRPTLLVPIDGEAVLRPVAKLGIERVINSPVLVLFDWNAARYTLFDGQRWRSARSLDGEWGIAESVPAAAAKLVGPHVTPRVATNRLGGDPVDLTEPPDPIRIHVATVPTELVVIQGPPRYTHVPGAGVSFVANSNRDIFLDGSDGSHYLLLSGRWYRGDEVAGPWTFVEPSALPAGFAKLPTGSPRAHVLESVAGTLDARDAVFEALLPQTTLVDRDAKLAVRYDGKAKFVPIEGTEIAWAENTSDAVFWTQAGVFCCQDGVWFRAAKPLGPWSVATEVPGQIYSLPPTHPLFPVTFVKVYGSTDEAVEVGYTSGYLGSYVSGGVVVHGTGYTYPSWIADKCYPRPATWGFAFTLDPRSGAWGVPDTYIDPYDFYFVDPDVRRGGWWGASGLWRFGDEERRDGQVDAVGVAYAPVLDVYDRAEREAAASQRVAQGPSSGAAGGKGAKRSPGKKRPPGKDAKRPPGKAAGAGKSSGARAAKNRAGTSEIYNDLYAGGSGDLYARGKGDSWMKLGPYGWAPDDRSKGGGKIDIYNLDRAALDRQRAEQKEREFRENYVPSVPYWRPILGYGYWDDY